MLPRDADAVRLFRGAHGRQPELIVAAPGRVNLLGDHTDYNGGFVLPAAIDRYTVLALSMRSDATVHLVSEAETAASFDTASLTKGVGWAEYVKGIIWALGTSGKGFDGAIVSDIPIGAGLSSSAALEVAIGTALNEALELGLTPMELAVAGQRAENDWVGMDCGLMDQMAVAVPDGPSALLIDCRDTSHRSVAIDGDVAIVVLDTGTSRNLTSSAYNIRRRECESAASALGIESLRDLRTEDLPRVEGLLDRTRFRRVRHVVTENARVLAMANAIDAGEIAVAGDLMFESHASLRDDYEASSIELDVMIDAAIASPGCLGARMTGAGWGGCGVALVDLDDLDAFKASTAERFEARVDRTAKLYDCHPVAGAAVLANPATSPKA